jgi:hypothetical protein
MKSHFCNQNHREKDKRSGSLYFGATLFLTNHRPQDSSRASPVNKVCLQIKQSYSRSHKTLTALSLTVVHATEKPCFAFSLYFLGHRVKND